MNREIIKTIKILEEETILCERYQFEKNALEDIVTKFTKENKYKINNEKFNILLNEYVEAFAHLNLYILYLKNKYLSKTEYNGKEFNINFDFCEMEIYNNNINNEGECKQCKTQ